MSTSRAFACFCAAFGSLLAASAAASQAPGPKHDFGKMQWIEISNGPNAIDIDGGNKNGLIFQAHRENYNAHSFERITFYQREGGDDNPSTSADKPVWNVIPFFAEGTTEKDSLETVQGADCRLRDWVVLRKRGDKRAPLTVIVADRDFGETYIDKKRVTFSVYELKRNQDESPGFPALYFEQVDQFRSRQTYCDADLAIRQELGVKLKFSPDSDGIDH
jgi:hypothetical protein